MTPVGDPASERVILQRATFPIGGPADAALYGRAIGGSARFLDGEGGVRLEAGVDFRTNTYMNVFALGRFRLLTEYRNFRCEFRVRGEGQVGLIAIRRPCEAYTTEESVAYQAIAPDQERVVLPLDAAPADTLGIYLWVQASASLHVEDIVFTADLQNPNPLRLTYVITSFNRPRHVARIIKDVIAPLADERRVNFLLVNQGDALSIQQTPNMAVISNRNLGGAGGFTRGALTAMDADASHVAFMDDDIALSPEAIRRTAAFLLGVKDGYRSSMLAGAMLSSEQRWIQYESYSRLDGRGFHPVGHQWDLREYGHVVAGLDQQPDYSDVLAGWWYCVIPVTLLQRYGLPLPVFLRGDDIEFSLRVKPTLITLNGVCVWHEPFTAKYSELSEDYLFPRNLLLIALLNRRFLPALPKRYLLRRFLKNLLTFNYLAASLNVRAVRDVVRGVYHQDSARHFAGLRASVARWQRREDARVGLPRSFAGTPPPPTRTFGRVRVWSKLLRQYLLPMLSGTGIGRAGFGRSVRDFVGHRRVEVFDDRAGRVRIAQLDRRRAFRLAVSMWRWWRLLKRQTEELSLQAEMFRQQASTREAWTRAFELAPAPQPESPVMPAIIIEGEIPSPTASPCRVTKPERGSAVPSRHLVEERTA